MEIIIRFTDDGRRAATRGVRRQKVRAPKRERTAARCTTERERESDRERAERETSRRGGRNLFRMSDSVDE